MTRKLLVLFSVLTLFFAACSKSDEKSDDADTGSEKAAVDDSADTSTTDAVDDSTDDSTSDKADDNADNADDGGDAGSDDGGNGDNGSDGGDAGSYSGDIDALRQEGIDEMMAEGLDQDQAECFVDYVLDNADPADLELLQSQDPVDITDEEAMARFQAFVSIIEGAATNCDIPPELLGFQN